MYLANQNLPHLSPGNFLSPAPAGVALPASVEELIATICNEQSQPPLGAHAKRKLALVGEEEALRLLNIIRRKKIIKSFDGFVAFLISSSPVSPEQESISSSPSRPASSSSFTSPNYGPKKNVVTNLIGDRFPLSPISAARQPGGPSILPCTNSRQYNEKGGPLNASIVATPNGQTFSPSADAQNPNTHAIVPSTAVRKPSGHTSATMLHALHELGFRKAFMILSYIGRNKLEDVTTMKEIKDLGAVRTMGEFEDRIWYRFGSRYCQKKTRVKQVDCESRGGYYYYHCYVNSDGSYSLQGPFLNKTATLLQKILGDENVLIVKFYDSDSSEKYYGQSVFYTEYYKVAEEGISVGLKRFRFFAYKDDGKKEKKNSSSGAIKSYYVNVDSFAQFYQSEVSFFDMMSIHDQRCFFMHVHNLSSLSAYMARFSLILSKTFTLEVDLADPDVHVEVIDDVPCKDANGFLIYDIDGKLQIHTDGTGYISEELALRCPQNCFKGAFLNDQFFERFLETVRLATVTCQLPDIFQPPLLIQFRMFHEGCAVKGTVLRNNKLPGKRIQVRPSMIKVEPDPGLPCIPAVNSFEIVSTSNRPRRTRLSRNLIALLNYGGVPGDFFSCILVKEIHDARNIFINKHSALRVAFNYGEIDDNCTVGRMILSGIPLDESYIQLRLPILGKEALTGLKQGKLPIQDSFYLMGTVDPTGSLNSNEVCIIYETGQIEGDVLVYRTPGVHFGDVHRLKATRIKGLEDIVGGSKYGIFFPINGPRSLADKMAGGDYDGDMYFVSRHPDLLKDFRQSEPWTPSPLCSQSTPIKRKPSDLAADHLENVLFHSFLTSRFQPCYSASTAANCWLSYMDQMLSLLDEQRMLPEEMLSLSDEQKAKKLELQNKMLRLVDIYYEALDAPKKGKKVEVPGDLIPKSYPHYMEQADKYKSTSILGVIFDKADELRLDTQSVEVRKLPLFDIKVPVQCIISWEGYYKNYRNEMNNALNSDYKSEREAAASKVIQNYKKTLYGADELEDHTRAWEDIRFDALAIYHVVYNFAMKLNDAGKCAFVWRVAGSALIKIYMDEQDEKPIYCLPSVLREIL